MPRDQRQTSTLRAAVVGYGAYGRLHAQKYRQHPQAELAAVVESNLQRRRQARAELPGVKVLDHVGELRDCVDLASVVVPASHHFDVARELLHHGVHLLVEKPFTVAVRDAHALVAIADRSGLVLQPGYLERFNLTLGELHEYLPRPRYIEARRLTSWRGRGADVSVVLDLMIHDIDMLLEIVNAPVVDIQARGVKIVTEQWDVANAQLRFANGCVANLTASRASPSPERRVHVFAEGTCALADIDAGEMVLHQRHPLEPGVMTERRICRNEDPLGAELGAFIEAVRHHATPLVDASDACRALRIAERIQDAMEPDESVLARTAMPLTDSERAIAYLLDENPPSHGLH